MTKEKCKYCNKMVDETEYIQNGGLVLCPTCIEEHTCEICGEVVDKLVYDDGNSEYMCGECKEKLKLERLESVFQ